MSFMFGLRNWTKLGIKLGKLSYRPKQIWWKKNLNQTRTTNSIFFLDLRPIQQTRSRFHNKKERNMFVASLDTMLFSVAIGKELRGPILKLIW